MVEQSKCNERKTQDKSENTIERGICQRDKSQNTIKEEFVREHDKKG